MKAKMKAKAEAKMKAKMKAEAKAEVKIKKVHLLQRKIILMLIFNEKKTVYEPVFLRKSFPFSFWYFGPITDKKIDEIKLFTEIYVKKLLKISKIQLYIFRGENEKR